MNIGSKIKIILLVLISFILVRVASSTIFIANTPKINTFALARLKNMPILFLNDTKNLFASIFKKTAETTNSSLKNNLKKMDQLPLNAYKIVTKGVYAKEDKETGIIDLRITKDLEFEERKMKINGKEVTIRFPKN